MTFQSIDAVWWPYLFIFLAGSVATDMWRFLGVYFAGLVDERAEILVFVRTVATALVAAVIAKLLLYPDGALAASPVWLRIGAAATGLLSYVVSGRRIIVGVAVAEFILLTGIVAA